MSEKIRKNKVSKLENFLGKVVMPLLAIEIIIQFLNLAYWCYNLRLKVLGL